ncbi:MAG: PAS domain-containing methyl-accepting chemotaxis protein [Microvirga sp.]|nr:PAS domain-containing methyl-accepting chemotaxis protein [Microvirga sp.]
MLWSLKQSGADLKLAAIDRAMASITFDASGNILEANENFLSVTGYSLDEIRGRHHAIFVAAEERNGAEYRAFWEALKSGRFQSGQFKRFAKDGSEFWIEATYNPLIDARGRVEKIVKFATDITERKRRFADLEGQISAIDKSHAVISFDLDGRILDANDNFCSVVGYNLAEIKGRHHRIFVGDETAASGEYGRFWSELGGGAFKAGQFRRFGKDGREIWIEASYNPIFDPSGRPYKVVKIATDITAQRLLMARLKTLIEENFAEIEGSVARSDAQATSALRAASETSQNVQTMAAAAEELAASVHEISESMAKSRDATETAFSHARSAGDFTRKLSEAAGAMGSIVGLIQTIAEQINLLALNATIESARAGEAGRGFAVVAQEVKNLANQAARATEQISAEIEGVQRVSQEVSSALGAIEGSVETMRQYVTSSASAVEEQSAVSRDMSSNMQRTSSAVSAISEGLDAMTAAVNEVRRNVAQTKEATQALAA